MMMMISFLGHPTKLTASGQIIISIMLMDPGPHARRHSVLIQKMKKARMSAFADSRLGFLRDWTFRVELSTRKRVAT